MGSPGKERRPSPTDSLSVSSAQWPMVQFCEYMGPFAGVCMQPQAPQALADELLRYCETHQALVRRQRQFLLRTSSGEIGGTRRVRAGSRELTAPRIRSEPYLRRSSSLTLDHSSSYRITVVDESDKDHTTEQSEQSRVDHASRSVVSPVRMPADASRAAVTPDGVVVPPTNDPATREPSEATTSFTPASVRRKRVRVKSIVIPSRFEVLDGSEPTSPPKVWYVRLADRVAGEPGDPNDDEFIEVDALDGVHPTAVRRNVQ